MLGDIDVYDTVIIWNVFCVLKSRWKSRRLIYWTEPESGFKNNDEKLTKNKNRYKFVIQCFPS